MMQHRRQQEMKDIGSAALKALLRLPLFSLLLALSAGLNNSLSASVFVVTTTSDLAYLAAKVGGKHVRTEALLRGSQDPHYADARPDFIVKLSRADLFVAIGLDLEAGWAPTLLRQSRNAKIQRGQAGYCDASLGVLKLEVPRGGADRSMGDIHAQGNPHYWLDPLNAAIMARNIKNSLSRVDPAHASDYESNYQTLYQRLRQLALEQLRLFKPLRGTAVAVYHKEFSYLSRRFGFTIAASLEEKPGVPPSAVYLKKTIETIRQKKIKVILIAPWNNPRFANAAAEQTGARVLVMPVSVGSEAGIDTYEKTIETMMSRLRAALQ